MVIFSNDLAFAFYDRPAGRFAWPILTAVSQLSWDTGRAAGETLLKTIVGEKVARKRMSQIFPARLVIRESTRLDNSGKTFSGR